MEGNSDPILKLKLMTNFKYFELISFYHRSIYDFLSQGESFEMANERAFDDFWDHSNQPSDLQNIIVLIESMNVEYALTKTYRSQPIKMYKELLEKIRSVELSKFMNEYEIEVFQESIEELNNQIEVFLKSNQNEIKKSCWVFSRRK